ncbi:MAG: Rrf2 family cysteine metabolism transcriptional repressor [bacterium]|jgi:Rrf2 family cysteine metabolism transcriptional repressor
MKISYKCDYALKVILDLSNHYESNLIHIEEIATRQDIPQNYLEQILLILKKSGFVKSKKGPKGGYTLARAPKEIILGDVIRAIEGSIYPISCVDEQKPQTCDFVSRCGFFGVWKEVGSAISAIVDHLTFEDIQARETQTLAKNTIHYHI